MAGRKVGSGVAVGLTRESLIALSYSLAYSNLPPMELSKNVKSVAEAVSTDEKHEVTCGLISISYAESPDTKDSTVSPEKNKGNHPRNCATTYSIGPAAKSPAYPPTTSGAMSIRKELHCLPPMELSKNVKSVAEAVSTDEKHEVTCGLISISYAESPDTKDSTVSPEKNKGNHPRNCATTYSIGPAAKSPAYPPTTSGVRESGGGVSEGAA